MTTRTDGDDPRLVELLLRWEELRDQGRTLSAEELCSTCPELAEELGRRIALLRQLDPLLDGSTTADSGRPQPPPAGRSGRASASARAEFRDLRFHAAGALGEVFMARNAELNRDVALKFLKPERTRDADSRRRFLQEAEVTGRLEHPGVVPIYALGTDASGAPCYAMRFIRGTTLQDAIDAFHADEKPGRDPSERSLALRELLDRFVSICNTMAYSHSRGILHRDLKPRNVMLGKYDETLVVDWGLAKAFERDDAAREIGEETLTPSSGSGEGGSDTPTMGVVGTPAYMSPEQAEASRDLVGPASDQFGLGAIFYAILTGQAPYQGRKVGEILEKVRQCEFAPPHEIRPEVPRALEAICLKAMAYRPEDRYATALELAADVRRWMADEPVSAYREPMTARLRRWSRRHRTLMISAMAGAVVGLIGLGGVAAVQAHLNGKLRVANAEINRALSAVSQANREKDEALDRSEEARRRAEAVLDFLQNGLVAAARPEGQSGGLGVEVTLRQAIDAAEPQIAEAFKDQPLVEADLRQTLGTTYHHLGEADRAIRQHERAAEIRRMKLGPEDEQTLESRNDLALDYADAGRILDAIRLGEETLRIRESNLGRESDAALVTRNNLGEAYRTAGRFADAIRMHEETHRLREAKQGPNDPRTLVSRNCLALAYQSAGRTDEAIRLQEETLRRWEALRGRDHPETLATRNNLASAYLEFGRTDDAIRLHQETLRIAEAKLGPSHPRTLASRNNLALAYEYAGRTAEAIPMHLETLQVQETKFERDHPYNITLRENLARAYLAAGRIPEAMRMLEETVRMGVARLGPDNPITLSCRHNLARTYRVAGRRDEAIRVGEDTLRRLESSLGPDHPRSQSCRGELAMAYRSTGRLDDAIRMLELNLRMQMAKLGPEHPETRQTRNGLAVAYGDSGRIADASTMLEELLRISEAQFGRDHPETLLLRSNLAVSYQLTDRLDEAIPLNEETLRVRASKLGPDHPLTLTSRNNLASVYLLAGRVDEGIALHEENLKKLVSKLGESHFYATATMNSLAKAYLTVRRWVDAEGLSRRCLAIFERTRPDDWAAFDARSLLGGALMGQGKFAEAEPFLLDGFDGMKARAARIPAPRKSHLPEAGERIVRLYEAWRRPEKAFEWRARLGLDMLPDDVFAPPARPHPE